MLLDWQLAEPERPHGRARNFELGIMTKLEDDPASV